MAGYFFWYELLTTNLEASASFFAGLLGCDVLRTEEPSSYFIAPKGTDSPLFGLVPIQSAEGTRSHWIGYLLVDDLDAAVAITEEAGGAVHAVSDDEEGRPSEAPRYAIVTDPLGAVVNLHQRFDEAAPAEALPGNGRLAWMELLTTDTEEAGDYYNNLVGWDVGPEFIRENEGVARTLARDGRVFGIVRDLPPGSPVPPNWTFYLRVPNLEEAVQNARLLGGFMYEEVAEVDGGRRVLMLDPTGAPVALWASS